MWVREGARIACCGPPAPWLTLDKLSLLPCQGQGSHNSPHCLTGVWGSDDRVAVTPLRNATSSSAATLCPVTAQPMGKVISDITMVDRVDIRSYR